MTKAEGPQMIVKPDAEGLAASARAAGKGAGPAPVHLWNPPFCGDLDMEIRRDGTWFYLGTPIGRAPLVKLFANILKLEEGRYYLVTPVEKVGIRVEDAPFVAVDFEVAAGAEGQEITFVTNVGDRVTAGPAAPIRVARGADGPVPYVMVRRGLEARIDRKSFYRLVDLGEVRGDGFGVVSQGAFFALAAAAEVGAAP
jgi:hypothetical protein